MAGYFQITDEPIRGDFGFVAIRVVDYYFLYFVGEEEERNSNWDEGDANDEECWQYGSCGEYWLPGREFLLFEGRI